MNPITLLRILIPIAVITIIYAGGWWTGANIERGRWSEKAAAAAKAQTAQLVADTKAIDLKDAAYALHQEQNRATARTITNEVIRYVSAPSATAADCAIDDAGMQLYLAALRGTPPTIEPRSDAMSSASRTSGSHGQDAGSP